MDKHGFANEVLGMLVCYYSIRQSRGGAGICYNADVIEIFGKRRGCVARKKA